MNIQIRGIGIPPTEALAAHIERRIAFSLSRFSSQLERIVVRFTDLNGPFPRQSGDCHQIRI